MEMELSADATRSETLTQNDSSCEHMADDKISRVKNERYKGRFDVGDFNNEMDDDREPDTSSSGNFHVQSTIHENGYSMNCCADEMSSDLEISLISKQLNERDPSSNIVIDKDVTFDNENDLNVSNNIFVTKDLENTKSPRSKLSPIIFREPTNSFLNMENSNNAIDICSLRMTNVEYSNDKNSNELSFNGTIKHLKKYPPISDFISTINTSENFPPSVMKISPNKNTHVSQSETIDKNSENFAPIVCKIDTIFSNSDISLENTMSVTPLKRPEMEESFDQSQVEQPRSPSLFSDNEDDLYDNRETIRNNKSNTSESLEYDKKLIKKLEKTLQGVPPPPSVTISQLSALEMLNLYHTNLPKYDCIGLNPTTSSTTDINYKSPSSDIVINTINTSDITSSKIEGEKGNLSEKLFYVNSTKELVINEKWPRILSCRYYEIYYNCTQYSEEVDCLLSKYLLRYIGCETASSYVSFMMKKSPIKRSLRSNIGKSPGRRLSHLARRKITFCSADNVKDIFTTKKQILVDRTKYSGLFSSRSQILRRSPRKQKTPKKKTPLKRTPKSKTPKKKTPNSSQKKKTVRRLFTNDPLLKSQPTKESSKRALFLSPENRKICTEDISASTSKISKSKRALFNTPQKKVEVLIKDDNNSNCDTTQCSRKRGRLDDSSDENTNQRVKLLRSFSFGGDKIESDAIEHSLSLSKHASENFLSRNDSLSDLHQKKLLWAVAGALRYHKIGVKHDKFRLHMSSLARLTRKLSQLPYHAQILRNPSTSTSETLLRIARQHSFSVISGKSIDEIFTEEQNKLNNLHSKKIIGYVPLNDTDRSKQSHDGIFINKNNENLHNREKPTKNYSNNEMKNVLQDKTVDLNINGNTQNIKLSTPDKKKLFSFRDNKLNACRQISFDTDTFRR